MQEYLLVVIQTSESKGSSKFSMNKMSGLYKDKGTFFKSNNELPNSSVCFKEDSFVSINLQSILLRVLRRVILLSTNKGQRRKKVKS